jgi:membrane protein
VPRPDAPPGPRAGDAVVLGTARGCLRYRVTGLAAEVAFFALLSLPALVLGLVASAGYVGQELGTDVLGDLRARIGDLAGATLTADAVHGVILRTFDEVVRSGRPDVVSVGFLVSLWSGSRALNVYLDTIAIMYGLGGHRGIVRTRLLSLALYVAALAGAVVVLPLLLLGPGALAGVARTRLGVPESVLVWGGVLSWPVLVLVAVTGLATLYHVAPPVRRRWRACLPGAGLALALWLLASLALRLVVGGGLGRTGVYGPLAAPVALLVWLYLLALAVLVGAALNATLAALPTGSALTGSLPRARPRLLRSTGSAVTGSLPRARPGLVHDAAHVSGRDPECGGDLPEPRPVGLTPVRDRQVEVGEPA